MCCWSYTKHRFKWYRSYRAIYGSHALHHSSYEYELVSIVAICFWFGILPLYRAAAIQTVEMDNNLYRHLCTSIHRNISIWKTRTLARTHTSSTHSSWGTALPQLIHTHLLHRSLFIFLNFIRSVRYELWCCLILVQMWK